MCRWAASSMSRLERRFRPANHGNEDLLVYAYGYPPEDETAELLDPAV